MAEIKVEDYPNEAVDVQDTDLFGPSIDVGGGSFESKKLSWATVKAVLLGIRRFEISKVFGDFSAAALKKNIEIFVLPAGFELSKITVKHEDAWAGPAITEVEIEVGITGELDRYVEPHDIFQAPGNKIFSHNPNNKIEDFGITTSVKANVRSVGANLDQLNAGSVDFTIYIERIK